MVVSTIQHAFQAEKQQAQQAYELARTARQPGRHRSLIGALGADADFHLQNQNDYLEMVAFVRMLERTDPLVASAGERLMANINVGQMTPSPNTGDEGMDRELKDDWKEYASDPDRCDAQKTYNYEAQADITLNRVIFDGDLMCLPEQTESCLHMEAHRCQTPTWGKVDRGVCGVETNGRYPTQYWLTKKSTPYGQPVKVSDLTPIPARDEDGWPNVFHVHRPKRFTLNRGVTSLAPCGTAASRRDDNEFAKILQAQVLSCVTFTEEITDIGALAELIKAGYQYKPRLPATFTQKDEAGFEMGVVSMSPGRFLSSLPGHRLNVNTPDIPGDGFFELNLLLIRYLGLCLDLPLVVLLMDASDTTFSSYRNALDQARMTFMRIQRWFAAMYHRKRWRHFVRMKLRTDKVFRSLHDKQKLADSRQSKVYRHVWNPVGWKYIHPVDDRQGDVIGLSNSLEDLDSYCRRRLGVSAEDHIGKVVKYNGQAIRAAIKEAKKIQTETTVDVDWRYLWAPPNRQGLGLQVSDDTAGLLEAAGVGGGR